jgi:hypothetical protein
MRDERRIGHHPSSIVLNEVFFAGISAAVLLSFVLCRAGCVLRRRAPLNAQR